MNKHPDSRYERRKALERFDEQKRKKASVERARKVKRRLTIDQLKAQEAEEELRNASRRTDHSS